MSTQQKVGDKFWNGARTLETCSLHGSAACRPQRVRIGYFLFETCEELMDQQFLDGESVRELLAHATYPR